MLQGMQLQPYRFFFLRQDLNGPVCIDHLVAPHVHIFRAFVFLSALEANLRDRF